MKDLFSTQSNEYAKFRPTYPPALLQELISLCPSLDLAWDAGTGNGQFANLLSPYFARVVATDISEKQLTNAVQKPNIQYALSDSTHVSIADHSADIVTVAQAVHWFNFEKFYAEVRRVLKNNGILALVSYGLIHSDPKVNEIIVDFYNNTLHGCWDPERRYVDEEYRTIPFPFEEIPLKKHGMSYTWNVDQLTGYFSTWSALQHYKKKNNDHDPLPELRQRFLNTGLTEFNVEFPVFGRVARVPLGNWLMG
jgi:ubiquinone/menaquinone biosynthesis C-methylase UbiE